MSTGTGTPSIALDTPWVRQLAGSGSMRADSNFNAIGAPVSLALTFPAPPTNRCYEGHTVFGNRTAVAHRERAAIERFPDSPKQLVMIYGPGLYQPTSAKKLAAHDAYSALLKLLLPDNPALKTGHLWHNDLHHENIFVDPEKPNEVLGIIDWQSTQIMPLVDHCLDPSFLGYEGPDVGDNLEPPVLPDEVDNLNGEEKTTALREFYAQSIMVAWRMVVRAKNPAQYNAIQFRNSKAGHLLHFAQNIAVLGEAHFRALLLDLRDEWAESPLAPEFPLQFSEGEVAEVEADVKAADLGIQIMNTIKQRLGDQWPEKGLIEHESFEVVMAELREIKAELMDRFAKSQE